VFRSFQDHFLDAVAVRGREGVHDGDQRVFELRMPDEILRETGRLLG